MKKDNTEGRSVGRFFKWLRVEYAPRMSICGCGRYLAWAVSCGLLLLSLNVQAADEQTFASLKVGDHTYQNVKVTTKGKNFIIIMHSEGISSIKISELPIEVLQKLGYAPKPAPKKHPKEGAMWAGLAVPDLHATALNPITAKLTQAWERSGLSSRMRLPKPSLRQGFIAGTILIEAYLFYAYCGMLICRKTGNHPGVWVWLPLVQILPMLRAASMSAWWFIAFLIPGLNLIAYVVWCVKIAQAFGKNLLLTILLLFPLTTWFAFIVLAFSEHASEATKEPAVEIMSLETA